MMIDDITDVVGDIIDDDVVNDITDVVGDITDDSRQRPRRSSRRSVASRGISELSTSARGVVGMRST